MADYEIIYLGRSNSIDWILYADSTIQDLSGVTEMRLVVGSAIVTSTDSTAGNIRWNQPGYDPGEVRIFAGGTTGLSTGKFTGALVVYDPSNTAGVVWDDNIPIKVKQDFLTT